MSIQIAIRDGTAHSSLLFEGEVSGAEQIYSARSGRQVRVRAYDLLYQLHARQSVRGYRDTTVAELAQSLVADLGLSVKAAQSGASRRWIVQHRQTDMDLLREMTQAIGLYAVVRGRTLHLLTLEGLGEPVALDQGASLLESRFDVHGLQTPSAVTGFGWDPATGRTTDGRAGRPRIGRDQPWAKSGGSGTTLTLTDVGFEQSHQVEQVSQGELDRVACRDLSLWGLASGDTRLQPGCLVSIAGVDPALAGRYVLTLVCHTVDRQSGFVSEISSYPPKRVIPPAWSSIVPGCVTAVDDPDHLGRIKTSLPTFSDLETDWMRVVSPGMGASRGFIALPDLGDQVAVAISHGDPARGLVLGGIFTGKGKLDTGVEGGRVRRFQLRAGDQVVSLDEKRGSVRIENQKGSFVELRSDGVTLHSVGSILIEAPGKGLKLRAARIDLEQA